MNNFSVLILTLDEEKDIEACIKSVALSNDIVVLDSFSTDKTKEIALAQNARVYERKFINYSNQRNFGLHQISFKNDFVLILDADERATQSLVQELLDLCQLNPDELPDVYFIRRRVLFKEKLLKWNYASNVWLERFMKPKKVSYVGYVHEKLVYAGENGFLKSYMIHNLFSKGMAHCIARRKKYALLEATHNNDLSDWKSDVDNVVQRRIKIKRFFVKYIPFYYVLYFIYNVLIYLSFLDGYKGLKYVKFEAYSLYLTSKYRSNVKKHKQTKVPAGAHSKA